MEIDVGEIPTAVTLEGGAGRIPKNLGSSKIELKGNEITYQ